MVFSDGVWLKQREPLILRVTQRWLYTLNAKVYIKRNFERFERYRKEIYKEKRVCIWLFFWTAVHLFSIDTLIGIVEIWDVGLSEKFEISAVVDVRGILMSPLLKRFCWSKPLGRCVSADDRQLRGLLRKRRVDEPRGHGSEKDFRTWKVFFTKFLSFIRTDGISHWGIHCLLLDENNLNKILLT